MMTIRSRLILIAWTASLLTARAFAQAPPTTTFTLVKVDPSARGGVVRINATDVGIVINGVVDGPAPRWPASRNDLERGDRIRVSIAAATPPQLPPIGWGHQFGDEVLEREEDCNRPADTTTAGRMRCIAWYRRQLTFRAKVARLFVRRWSLAPSIAVESVAEPAFATFDDKARQDVALLEPAGAPQLRFAAGEGGRGYTFDLSIPWEALPPISSTTLDALRILVDVYSVTPTSASARSTIASTANIDEPATFPVVPVLPVREYTVGPCRASFADPVIQHGPEVSYQDASDSAHVYFRPSRELDLRRVIVLDNPAHGYQYQPDSASNSPVAQAADFWAVALGGGETLCGPHLAYRRAAQITRSELVVAGTDSLTTRRLANGDVLVKSGPRVFSSYFGAGQCGGCPRVQLEIIHLDHTSGTISSAFKFRGIAEPDDSDVDIAVSPDWSEITVFEMTADNASATPIEKWRSTTHCYRPATHTYEQCRSNAAASPPSPRRVRPVSLSTGDGGAPTRFAPTPTTFDAGASLAPPPPI